MGLGISVYVEGVGLVEDVLVVIGRGDTDGQYGVRGQALLAESDRAGGPPGDRADGRQPPQPLVDGLAEQPPV